MRYLMKIFKDKIRQEEFTMLQSNTERDTTILRVPSMECSKV